MADELRQQVPLIKEMLKAMGITIVEKEGYEADDILGTLSVKAEKEGMDVAVISGDRDLLQLATEHVMIRIPKTKKTGTEIENYLADDVVEKYGVTPKEFIDVKALQGDTADNIPGVPGIGEKTAGALIAKYHSIEAVYEDAPNVKPPRASKNIVEFWDQAVMSKELATIITDAPVDYEFKDAQIDGIDSLYTEEAFMMCKRLEFKNLLPRFDVQAPKNNVEENFKVISDQKSLDDIIKRASKKDVAFSIIPGKPGGEDTDGQLSLFEQNDTNDYIALVLVFSEEDIYFIKTGKEITSDYLNKQLEALDANTWISPDLKKNLHLMKAGGFTPDERKKYFDMTVAAYLLNPLLGDYPYDGVAKDYLSIVLSSKKDYLGKLTCEQMIKEDEKKVVDYECYEAYIAWKSKEILESNLKEKGMYELYENIEMPLVFVLYDMEKEGIRADGDKLKEYSRELAVSINKKIGRAHV